MSSHPLEIRCTCSRHPLLAVAGRDDRGKPYVHIKAHKQQKVITELVATSGLLRIRCRNCDRWLALNIRSDDVTARNEPLPSAIRL